MPILPDPFEAAGGRLLRVLFLRISEVSPDPREKELLRFILKFLKPARAGLLLLLLFNYKRRIDVTATSRSIIEIIYIMLLFAIEMAY